MEWWPSSPDHRVQLVGGYILPLLDESWSLQVLDGASKTLWAVPMLTIRPSLTLTLAVAPPVILVTIEMSEAMLIKQWLWAHTHTPFPVPPVHTHHLILYPISSCLPVSGNCKVRSSIKRPRKKPNTHANSLTRHGTTEATCASRRREVRTQLRTAAFGNHAEFFMQGKTQAMLHLPIIHY